MDEVDKVDGMDHDLNFVRNVHVGHKGYFYTRPELVFGFYLEYFASILSLRKERRIKL